MSSQVSFLPKTQEVSNDRILTTFSSCKASSVWFQESYFFCRMSSTHCNVLPQLCLWVIYLPLHIVCALQTFEFVDSRNMKYTPCAQCSTLLKTKSTSAMLSFTSCSPQEIKKTRHYHSSCFNAENPFGIGLS